jgi:hypothetical protein
LVLDDVAKAARSRDGVSAIRDLLDLAVSELLACAAWRPEIEVADLPNVRVESEKSRRQRGERIRAAMASRAASKKARRDEAIIHAFNLVGVPGATKHVAG